MKTCQFYAVGPDKKNLLAYDEYDSEGGGFYYTDDLLMIERYTCKKSKIRAKEKDTNVWLVTISKEDDGGIKIKIELMFPREELSP
jgi:hypothetical protein